MIRTTLHSLLWISFLGSFTVLLLPESAKAQTRTWHYNSNNYTQPGSMPWYSGAPNRRLPFWRRPAAVATPVLGGPAIGAPAIYPAVPAASSCGGSVAPAVSYAAPQPACATGCQPGGITQTVGYVPQTVYRTVYRQVPVTRYQPVASCGPCGQSVTTYVQQAQQVAMTSYLAVPTVTYRPATCLPTARATASCATGACGVTTAGYISAAPSCSTCAPAAAPATIKPLRPTPASPLGSSTDLGSGRSDVPQTFEANKPAENDNIDLNGPANGKKDEDSSSNGVDIDMGKEVEPSEISPSSTTRGLFSTPRFLSPQDLTTQHNQSFQVRPAVYTQPISGNPTNRLGREKQFKQSQAEQDARGWESVSGK